MDHSEIAVLGAGIMGCCLALDLAQRGHRVDLIEYASEPMTGASLHNEGKLHLGFVYANDPLKATHGLMLRGSLAFSRIIERLTGMETSSLVVLNSENMNVYLTKVPLFADFWRDKPSSFSKVIVAVVDKRLVNESIRIIESITGNLNECEGVMVTSQELSYAAGSL